MVRKLMIVKENINFEKGLDPKAAMEIGLKPEIVRMRNELSEMYDEAMDKIDDPHYAGQIEVLELAIGLIDNLTIMKDENS
jgi:hypothetical protein